MTAKEWLERFDAALIAAPARRHALREELSAHFADALEAGEEEAAATRAAGPPERVAAESSREDGLLAVERALWLLSGGVGALGLYWLIAWCLYPRGQWESPPHVLYAPHHLGLGAWSGVGLTGIATLLALRWRRLSRHHPQVALVAAVLLVVGLGLHLLAGNIYVWLRNDIVAGSPSAAAQAALSAAHFALGGLAALPLVGATRRLAAGCRRS